MKMKDKKLTINLTVKEMLKDIIASNKEQDSYEESWKAIWAKVNYYYQLIEED